MKDSESKKAWMKENSTMIGARLNHNTDADIVEYLKTVDSTGGTIKKALRLLIAQEAPSAVQPTAGEEVENISAEEELEALYGDLPWDEKD